MNKSVFRLRVVEFCVPFLCAANSSRELALKPEQFIHRDQKIVRSFLRMFGTISTNPFQLSKEKGSSTFFISGSCTSVHIYSDFARSNNTNVSEGLMLVTRLECR